MTGIGAYILITIIILVNSMVLTLIYFIYRGSIKNIENLRMATVQLTKNHETFSAIAVAMDAKLNATIEAIDIHAESIKDAKDDVSDILALLIPSARIILEIKQLVSRTYSKENPDEAHIEGKRTGASEEAMAQAKAKIAADKKAASKGSRGEEAEAEDNVGNTIIALETTTDPLPHLP